MALHWTIDPQNRQMMALAAGDVARAEVEGFLDAVLANQALGYRKLFDASQAGTSMVADDFIALGVRMRSMRFHGPMGPLAIVVPAERAEALDRMFGMIAAADRPMRMFRDVEQAQRWFEAHVGVAAPDPA